MSAQAIQWLTVLIFFLCLFALTAAEAAWLSRKGDSPFGKAFAFSFATNIFNVTVGFAFSFAILGTLMVLTFGGGLEGVSGNDWRIWSAVIAALLGPVLLSVLIKRLGIRIFRLDPGSPPWIYSFAASIVFLLLVTAAPVIFVYFFA